MVERHLLAAWPHLCPSCRSDSDCERIVEVVEEGGRPKYLEVTAHCEGCDRTWIP